MVEEIREHFEENEGKITILTLSAMGQEMIVDYCHETS